MLIYYAKYACNCVQPRQTWNVNPDNSQSLPRTQSNRSRRRIAIALENHGHPPLVVLCQAPLVDLYCNCPNVVRGSLKQSACNINMARGAGMMPSGSSHVE